MTTVLTEPETLDFDNFAADMQAENFRTCKAAALLITEGRGGEVDRQQLAVAMTGAGWTAEDLRRHVDELKARKQAFEDEAEATKVEAELPALEAAVKETVEKVRAENDAHRERMKPLYEANDKADCEWRAKRSVPRELRMKAATVRNKTMSPEHRETFGQLSDKAVKSKTAWQELEQKRPRRERAVATSQAELETLEMRLESMQAKPNTAKAQENTRADIAAAKAAHTEAVEALAEIDTAAKMATEADEAFQAFQLGPMRDWREKSWD